MLGLMSFLVVIQNRRRNRTLMPWVVAVMMLNVVFFASLVAFVSNPFEALPAVQARDMKPVGRPRAEQLIAEMEAKERDAASAVAPN